jgi:RHS repeat-associated protein
MQVVVTILARRFHRNQQYSITALTDGGGNVTERYAYDAYGSPTILDGAGISLTTSAANNRYTYTGREFDEALGLYHYRARMYDSVAGRFCSRDPIGFEGSPWNLYEFVDSRPLVKTDPSGERSWTCITAAACLAVPIGVCGATCASGHWDVPGESWGSCMKKCLNQSIEQSPTYTLVCLGAIASCGIEKIIPHAAPPKDCKWKQLDVRGDRFPKL